MQPERIPEEDTEIIPANAETIPVGQCMDNAPQYVREVEGNIQENTGAAGVEETATASEVPKAAGAEETDTELTAGQREVLDWLDLIRRKVVPEDGSRPDWVSIRDELKTMERYVAQFTI